MSEMPTAPIGRWLVMPTTNGQISWRNNNWGVEVREKVYVSDEETTMRLPWAVLKSMAEHSVDGH